MSQLIEDCLIIIFNELIEEPSSLYSCILVNRFWCRIAMPILWKDPFEFDIGDEDSLSHHRLYNLITSLLPTSSKKLLLDEDIVSPIQEFSNQSLFNYISFSSQVPPNFINNMINNLIKKEVGFDKYKEKNKKNLLEQEIYKLFINNCKDIKHFNWQTTQPLSQFQGASTCFSQLCSLIIDLQMINPKELFTMTQICQNIEELSISGCCNIIPEGLIWFIDTQKYLRSLSLYFKGVKIQCLQLSEVIERKAATLKKLSIGPNIIILSPKFLPSLIKLEYLELNEQTYKTESIEMCEWKKHLLISSFPNLQYLKTAILASCEYHALIEKSIGNILEINILHTFDQNREYTNKLIKAIAEKCPKIENLTINAELENLDGIKEILLNCTQLKMINLSTDNKEKNNCDKLLEILTNYSPKTLYEFSFNENWKFSIEGLEIFFKNWRNKKPLAFTMKFIGDIDKEYKRIVEKYYEEGIIKENLLDEDVPFVQQ
ncbi:unnamed protein product [Rhizophagus irregularis]|nr:unnamed protein product [Rhizophagus irregularis]